MVAKNKPQGPGQEGWQAHKSESTRTQILDAAVECIVELGYANTTALKISERANLSRGATLHHFRSKSDIIAATVDYLYEKRKRAFSTSAAKLPTDTDRVKLAVQAYWEHANHPLFVAFFELSVAARHDEQLNKILVPAQQKFDEEWYAIALDLFPEWKSDAKAFKFALELSQTMMEGMAISHLMHPRSGGEADLLEFLEEQIRAALPAS
jgi:AcrR family transcriptional regulator